MTATTETPSVTSDGVDFVHTGPGTLAGRYLRMFWHPVYVSRGAENRLRRADPYHGRKLHALSRRERKALHCRFSLRPSRHAAIGRLGRGRLHPLFLSWLEIRRRRPMHRAASGKRKFRAENNHS